MEGVGVGVREGEGRGKEKEERVRHENGWVTISAEEYTALREAKEAKEIEEAEEGVREAEEQMREAEGELNKTENEWKEAYHKLWETKQKLREADEEERKTKVLESASHDSIQPKNGYVTMSKTQYTALMETVEAEKKVREIDKNQSKAENEIRKAHQKLRKAGEELKFWAILGLYFILLGATVIKGFSYVGGKLKRKLEIGPTIPESTEDVDAISNNAGSSKESSQTWAMSKFLWAAND